jgi:hypothetical protein
MAKHQKVDVTNMIRHTPWICAATLLISACGSRDLPIIEMYFGRTNWVWNAPGPASDFISDFHTKIPQAALQCRVSLLGMNGGITDGGEAAYFLPLENEHEAKNCLERALPQGEFNVIERENWDKMTKEHPDFPIPLRLIPEQISEPPPPNMHK